MKYPDRKSFVDMNPPFDSVGMQYQMAYLVSNGKPLPMNMM